MLFLQDLTMMAQIPEPMIPFLKYDDIAKILASNRGLEYTKMLKTDEELEEDQQEAQDQQTEAQMNEAIAGGIGQQIGLQAT